MNTAKAKSFGSSACPGKLTEGNGGGAFSCSTALIVGALLGTACAEIHTKTPNGEPLLMNQDEFSAYVEHVFRHHNRVVNDSLFLANGNLKGSDDPMYKAEVKMDDACQPLNELALASAEGMSPGYWTKIKLADAVPECEAATRSLEKLFSQGK